LSATHPVAVPGGSPSSGQRRLFAFPACLASALAEPRSQTPCNDSKSPCSAGKATHGAAAERCFLTPSRRIPILAPAPAIPGGPHGRLTSSRIPTRPPQIADPAGLSPGGLQPCRLLTHRPGWLSLRRPPASLRFLPPAPPSLPHPYSQTLSHDSKSPCSVGKATPRAAAERFSLTS
jgi:hypothetical protein